MPTYEYGCEACGNQWEQVQRITEPPVEVCPKCGKTAAHRLISAGTNFILKGGGWYSDLYSSSSGGAKKTASKDTTSSDTAKSETKTETKTESKPASTTPSGSSAS